MPYTPRLGIRVVRPTAELGAGAAHNIFTIAGGPVLLTSLIGVVTTLMDGTASTLTMQHSLGPTTISGALAAIADDPVGTVYTITGVFADLCLKIEPGVAGVIASGLMTNGIVMILGTIQYLTTDAQTGWVEWSACYIPLVDGATIVAA